VIFLEIGRFNQPARLKIIGTPSEYMD